MCVVKPNQFILNMGESLVLIRGFKKRIKCVTQTKLQVLTF